MEIEKKFKIKQLPANIEQYQSKKIEQGYLCTEPTIRIRRSGDNYYLTYKSKVGIEKEMQESAQVSNEIEAPLNREGYLHLRKKIDYNLIQKTRYLIPIMRDLTAELDIFEGQLSGLVFVEVEFPSLERAKKFVPPEWFGKEITGDYHYRNSYLATLDNLDFS